MALKGLKRRLEAIQALKLSYEAVAAKMESEERKMRRGKGKIYQSVCECEIEKHVFP